MKSLAQRYLIAATAFAAATVALGVGLVGGLECLMVFLLTSLFVKVVQRRQLVAERGASSHRATRSARHDRRRAGPDARDRRDVRRPASRSQPARSLYDDEADSGGWPQLAERRW